MCIRDRFIGGEWVAPSSTSFFEVHSPSTGELVGRTPEAMEADIDKAVAAAREACLLYTSRCV